MNPDQIKKAFKRMHTTLVAKGSFHKKYRRLYDGEYTASSLGIALPAEYDDAINIHLEWPRTAVDNLANRQLFDAFKNDSMGFTRLLDEAGAYPVFGSAIRNSQIGSCAFVAIYPRNITLGELPVFVPYTGAEATGIYDDRTNKLRFGLVINSKNEYGIPLDYLFFERGKIRKLDANGELLSTVELPINETLLVPFIYDQDLAHRPFGSTRINKGCQSALDMALRAYKLKEIGDEVGISMGNLLISDGDADSVMKSDFMTKLGRLTGVFTEQGSTVDVKQLIAPSTKEMKTTIDMARGEFAAAASMSVTHFGGQPSNGSFGPTASLEQAKPYNSLLDSCRESYGQSIKKCALYAMGLLTGRIDPDWSVISPVWYETADDSTFGQYGDAIGKIKELVPDLDLTEITRQKLGISLKESLLSVRYPNFTMSQELASSYKELEVATTDAEGNLILNEDNIPGGGSWLSKS